MIELVDEIRTDSHSSPRTVLNWGRCNYNGIREFLNGYHWNLNRSMEEDWEEFKNVVTGLVNEFVPLKKWRPS
jgi:hypothetical protein